MERFWHREKTENNSPRRRHRFWWGRNWLLKLTFCCKICGNTLKVICKEHQESGLGKNLKLCCKSDNYKDNEFTNTEKDENYFKINRTSLLAFRTIGKGRSAAEKFLAVMNLGSPVSKPSWKKHGDVLLVIASEISKENMNEAGKDGIASGELPSKDPISAGFSSDCSWNARGWHGKKGVISAISESTGKIVDVCSWEDFIVSILQENANEACKQWVVGIRLDELENSWIELHDESHRHFKCKNIYFLCFVFFNLNLINESFANITWYKIPNIL